MFNTQEAVEVNVSGILAKLNSISLELEKGQLNFYSELRDFIEPFRRNHVVAYVGQLPKPLYTTLWLLTEFVFEELENSFGGDNHGFPAKECGPLFTEALKELGHFIQSNLFRHSSSILCFADALADLGKMVKIIDSRQVSSWDFEKDWVRL